MQCETQFDETQTKYSPKCGSPAKQFCPKCGIEHSQKFCPECGTAAPMQNQHSATAAQPNIIINNESKNTNTNVNTNVNSNGMYIPKSRMVALLFCIFLGFFGGHMFYTGKTGMGILYLLTFGLFCIGWIVDIIRIPLGAFRDR